MIFKEITLEECKELYDSKGLTTILNDGEVKGFEKSISGNNSIHRFVFFHKPKRKRDFRS